MNPETALDNKLQSQLSLTEEEINKLVHQEFDQLIKVISDKIEYIIFQDTAQPETPDSIFPNNWFSTENNQLTLYPMKANNRRLERDKGGLELILKAIDYKINDLTNYEAKGIFLEGTGVLVYDHAKKITYCALSERAHLELAEKRSEQIHYQLISFHTADNEGNAIYHTNVMMAVLEKSVVICLDVIRDQNQKEQVIKSIESSQKTLISVSYQQMLAFCCNILQVNNYILMSTQAYENFTPEQIAIIEKSGEILHSALNTIETLGGGGCRCMLAELFPTNN